MIRTLVAAALTVAALVTAAPAHAEPAPVNNLARFNPCEPLTYRYFTDGEHRRRKPTKAAVADVVALTGITIVAAAPGVPADIDIRWARLPRDRFAQATNTTGGVEGWNLRSDITMNTRYPQSPRAHRAIVTHEMGHALGLGHSLASGNLMSAHAQVRTTNDDRAAFASLSTMGCAAPIQIMPVQPTVPVESVPLDLSEAVTIEQAPRP